jgi:hypothetical protein
MWMDRFPQYPNTTRVCDEHVVAASGHVDWSSYASADDDVAVASFIAREMNRGSASHEIAVDDYRLTVHAVDDPAYPRCSATPPAGTKTIVIVSRMIR